GGGGGVGVAGGGGGEGGRGGVEARGRGEGGTGVVRPGEADDGLVRRAVGRRDDAGAAERLDFIESVGVFLARERRRRRREELRAACHGKGGDAAPVRSQETLIGMERMRLMLSGRGRRPV